MQWWRFLHPSALGFTLKTSSQALLDKVRQAPPRTVQATRFVAEHARSGDPLSVLQTLDRFAREERWLMSVGPDKGPLITELAERVPPGARVLELGSYCGYSAVMMASTLGPQANIISVDIDATAIECARQNVEMAGLSSQVTFIQGPSSQIVSTLTGHFDLVFLDHWKDLYKGDLQTIEERGLIGYGSIVVADNVGEIFAPKKFLDYVRNCGLYDCEHRRATIEYTRVPDAVEIAVYRSDPLDSQSQAAPKDTSPAA